MHFPDTPVNAIILSTLETLKSFNFKVRYKKCPYLLVLVLLRHPLPLQQVPLHLHLARLVLLPRVQLRQVLPQRGQQQQLVLALHLQDLGLRGGGGGGELKKKGTAVEYRLLFIRFCTNSYPFRVLPHVV